jgi:hypothetical protein
LERYVRTVVPKRVLGELGASSVQRPFAQVQGYVSDEVVIATAARREVAAAVLPGQRQETPQNPQAQELAEWTRIRDSNDLRVFEAFLRAYPDGSLRRDALLRVEDLKWAAARDAKDVAAIEGYLREYPQGRHAAESKTLLGQLRPPAPAPAAAPAATPAPPPASRPPAEADAIREILRQYGEAYRTRNTQRIAELWPTLTAEQLRQFSSYFQDLVTIEYELAPLAEPEIRGETATVRCQQSSRFVDNRRTERSAQDVVNVVLRKRQGAWRIDALQSEGRGP